jgi:16S rRNA (guanine527-N7)-methyltransferase
MSAGPLLTDESQARKYIEALCNTRGMEKLEGYAELLIQENSQQNLISKPSEDHLWVRHLADSAQLLRYVPRETYDGRATRPWLDLGSGPGLPGLVIGILRPEIPVILVESRKRRVEFMQNCIDELSLENCEVIGERLERIESFKAWVISARAFAPLDKLLRLSAPFSTKHTCYLLPKGRSAAHELAAAKPTIRKMFHVERSLTDPEAGIIVGSGD